MKGETVCTATSYLAFHLQTAAFIGHLLGVFALRACDASANTEQEESEAAAGGEDEEEEEKS